MGWPLTRAATALGSTGGLAAGVVGGVWAPAKPQARARVRAAHQERCAVRMSFFLLVPVTGVGWGYCRPPAKPPWAGGIVATKPVRAETNRGAVVKMFPLDLPPMRATIGLLLAAGARV